MAEEEIKEQVDKKEKRPRKKRKGGPKFLKLGKYFLLLFILIGQGVVAYAIVDKYYPSVYAKMNEENEDDYVVYQMEELVVNPAQTYGKRYLLVEISLEIADSDHVVLIDTHLMKLKQDIIESLSSRTIPQLTEVANREELRKDLSEIINSTIGTRSVRNLYFTKYVMQ